jgi:hypothetical protein
MEVGVSFTRDHATALPNPLALFRQDPALADSPDASEGVLNAYL